MSKLVVSAWITLDGIFDADSMDQWFHPYASPERQEHIRESILAADALLLGRITYEMLASYWPYQKTDANGPASKLNSVSKYVVSATLQKAEWQHTTILKGPVVEAISRLKQQNDQEIQIEGSAILVHSLMETDLIDEYRLLVHPVLMGSGKRFWKSETGLMRLKLVSTRTLPKGVVALSYQPKKE